MRVNRVLEVTRKKLSYLTGTVYLHMALKPSILSDLLIESYSTPPAPLAKIWSEKDEILLEDESGRVRLVGNKISVGMFVTGIVIGVLGRENKAGDFEVEEICYPGIAEKGKEKGEEKMSIDSNSNGKGKERASEDGEWIALISGLDLGGATQVSDLRVQLLSEFLIGELGDDEVSRFSFLSIIQE